MPQPGKSLAAFQEAMEAREDARDHGSTIKDEPVSLLRSPFAAAPDEQPGLTCNEIVLAIEAKRIEQGTKLRRLGEISQEIGRLHKEQAEILQAFDA